MITIPNFTHFSELTILLVCFESLGIIYVCKSIKTKAIFTALFLLALIITGHSYFVSNNYSLHNIGTETPQELKYAIKKADSLHRNVTIISPQGKSMYVIPRFYKPISPYKFNKVKSKEPLADHIYYRYYDKWYFSNSLNCVTKNHNSAYLISDKYGTNAILSKMHQQRYGPFILYW